MKKSRDEVTSLLPLKTVEFLVLAVLKDGKRHGYGIVQEMDERTQGTVRVRPGDLYRVLYRLQHRGLLLTAGRQTVENGERRTYYGLTRLGRRVLRAEADLLSGIIAQVTGS